MPDRTLPTLETLGDPIGSIGGLEKWESACSASKGGIIDLSVKQTVGVAVGLLPGKCALPCRAEVEFTARQTVSVTGYDSRPFFLGLFGSVPPRRNLMTYFHSVVDSPERVQSWLVDTWRWTTTADGDTEFRIDIDEPPGGPVVIRERGRRHRAGTGGLCRRIGTDWSQCRRRPATCFFLGCPGVAALHRHRSVGTAVPPDRGRIH